MRRTSNQISASILNYCLDGAKITRIMYDAVLSYPRTVSYIKGLEDLGLLKYFRSEKKYYTTKAGKEMLAKISALNERESELFLKNTKRAST